VVSVSRSRGPFYEKRLTNQVFPYQYRGHYLLSWKSDQWAVSEEFEQTTLHHGLPINTDLDNGGPWKMWKSIDKLRNMQVNTSLFSGPVGVSGPAGVGWNSQPVPNGRTDAQLTTDGSTMVARTLPNNPAADLSVAAAEIIREGVPSILGLQTMRDRTSLARSAGGEYLNVEFGWKPLVSEVRSLAKAVKDSEQILSNYRKGSDQKTRVGYHMLDDANSVSYTGGNFLPVPSRYNEFGYGTVHSTTRSKIWFSGAFRYHIPVPEDLDGKMDHWSRQASLVLGLRLDPEVLWNLAPWSWAVDWFSNAGDIFHNISLLREDGMVLQYGYAMAEQSVSESTTARFPHGTASREKVTKRCRRIPANPYGFGVTFESLSARQTAILVALGLSKGH
jgi:hypothetical protein